jgi:hypothetical protein
MGMDILSGTKDETVVLIVGLQGGIFMFLVIVEIIHTTINQLILL